MNEAWKKNKCVITGEDLIEHFCDLSAFPKSSDSVVNDLTIAESVVNSALNNMMKTK